MVGPGNHTDRDYVTRCDLSFKRRSQRCSEWRYKYSCYQYVSGSTGNFFVSKIVDATLESNLRYSNYLVCSVTRAELNDKKSILSVGVLSHVFVLFNKDDLQKLVDKEVGNAWEGLMGTGKELLGIGQEILPQKPAAKEPSMPSEEESPVAIPEEGQTTQQPADPQTDKQPKSLEDVIVEKAERAVEKGIDKAIEGFLEELLGK